MKNALLSTLVLLSSVAAVQAENLVYDTFNEYSLGELPVGAAPAIWRSAVQNEFRSSTIVQDTENLFGEGTANRFLRLSATRGDGGQSLTTTYGQNLGTTGQLSLQFYNPSGFDTYANGWILRLGTSTANAGSAFALSIQNGSLYLYTGNSINRAANPFATYSLDTLNSLVVVFNNSTQAINYADGSLVAGTMDVWLNGNLVGQGLSGTGNVAQGTDLQVFNFASKADFRGVLYVDNVAISNTIAIPESGSVALSAAILVGLAGVLHFRRRRRAASAA